MHAIGVPDQYIMQRGGWATDGVMKKVYRDTIDEQTIKMNQKINQHFSEFKGMWHVLCKVMIFRVIFGRI